MKKIICLIVLLQVVCRVFAQDITISFHPKVSDAPIDSILATNLRTNQSVKLSGGESLLLVKTLTGINPVLEIIETGYIYPNPTDKVATFCYSMDKSEEVEIRLYNINGQLLNQNRLFLEQGIHRFELKFPMTGVYLISVRKSDGLASFKAVYVGSKIQNTSIQYTGSEKLVVHNRDANQLKLAKTNKTLNYTDGDFIQYSVFSGVNNTILSETPTVSKAFEVEFVNCIDKNKRSYKAVKIGNQWWMAENLAYFPTVYPSSNGSRIDPRYYVYGYQGIDMAAARNTANYATYGVLYNWPAAIEACPSGWHLPSDAEWTELTTFLGGEETVAGSKLKEREYNHWTKPNAGATNEMGFSALPAGNRDWWGAFSDIGRNGIFWSSTIDNTSYAWTRYLTYGFIGVYRYSRFKEMGFSVRCLKD